MPIHEKLRLGSKIETVEVTYTCNVCGNVIRNAWDDTSDVHIFQTSGGYASKYPVDMETIKIIVCSDCLYAWTQTFKIPPDSSSTIESWCYPISTREGENQFAIKLNECYVLLDSDKQRDAFNFYPLLAILEKDEDVGSLQPNSILQISHEAGQLSYRLEGYYIKSSDQSLGVILTELHGESLLVYLSQKSIAELQQQNRVQCPP